MEYTPKPEELTLEEDNSSEVIEITEATRKLAVLALISALEDDCASGPNYPNIPFGD